MPWRVTGTREKLYRVETADDVSVWVDDEIDSMRQGWVPLTSELQGDGSMRVVYGQLPDEYGRRPDEPQAEPPGVHPVAAGRSIGAVAEQAVTSLVAVGLLIVATIATLALVAGRP